MNLVCFCLEQKYRKCSTISGVWELFSTFRGLLENWGEVGGSRLKMNKKMNK